MKKETMARSLVGGLSVGVVLAFLMLISGSYGGNVFGAEGAPLAPVQYTIHFSQTEFSFGKLKGYDMVRLDDGGYLAQRSKPRASQPSQLKFLDKMRIVLYIIIL